MNIAPLIAQVQPAGLADSLLTMVPLALVILVFYVIWFLPLRKRQKQVEQVVANLERGNRVVTNGGIFGEVVRAEGPVVVLKIADNVKIRVRRVAIAGLEDEPDQKG